MLCHAYANANVTANTTLYCTLRYDTILSSSGPAEVFATNDSGDGPVSNIAVHRPQPVLSTAGPEAELACWMRIGGVQGPTFDHVFFFFLCVCVCMCFFCWAGGLVIATICKEA